MSAFQLVFDGAGNVTWIWICVMCTAVVRAMASQAKIKVDNPVVDLDGDEMTRCDIGWLK